MSSLIGHSLAAATISVAAKMPVRPGLWTAWLIVVASAPDIDYLIPSLRLTTTPPARLTHSLIGCEVVPLLTCITLALAGLRGRELLVRSLQAAAAGLSHVVLDQLVGVTPAPLLWPFSLQLFKPPFGILPSAGGLRWNNGLLIRNLLIEVGTLLPVFLIVWSKTSKRRISGIVEIALAAVSCASMAAAFYLKR